MVSYTRARAEALGVECKVGIADRAVRVVILSVGLVFAKGAGIGDVELLAPAVYVLAGAVGRHRRPAHLARAAASSTPASPAAVIPCSRTASPRLSQKEITNVSTSTGRADQRRRRATRSDKVRVAIIGVGNCASSFVQGVQYYKDADPAEPVPGLMHVDLGGYHVRDIEFSAAFDIDADKVGKDLSEAIWSPARTTR